MVCHVFIIDILKNCNDLDFENGFNKKWSEFTSSYIFVMFTWLVADDMIVMMFPRFYFFGALSSLPSPVPPPSGSVTQPPPPTKRDARRWIRHQTSSSSEPIAQSSRQNSSDPPAMRIRGTEQQWTESPPRRRVEDERLCGGHGRAGFLPLRPLFCCLWSGHGDGPGTGRRSGYGGDWVAVVSVRAFTQTPFSFYRLFF